MQVCTPYSVECGWRTWSTKSKTGSRLPSHEHHFEQLLRRITVLKSDEKHQPHFLNQSSWVGNAPLLGLTARKIMRATSFYPSIKLHTRPITNLQAYERGDLGRRVMKWHLAGIHKMKFRSLFPTSTCEGNRMCHMFLTCLFKFLPRTKCFENMRWRLNSVWQTFGARNSCSDGNTLVRRTVCILKTSMNDCEVLIA